MKVLFLIWFIKWWLQAAQFELKKKSSDDLRTRSQVQTWSCSEDTSADCSIVDIMKNKSKYWVFTWPFNERGDTPRWGSLRSATSSFLLSQLFKCAGYRLWASVSKVRKTKQKLARSRRLRWSCDEGSRHASGRIKTLKVHGKGKRYHVPKADERLI